MEITCDNFRNQFSVIENVINGASFVAFDLEFLGLEDEDVLKRCSLFDSPNERIFPHLSFSFSCSEDRLKLYVPGYEKTLSAVRQFPPAQLGLSFFTAIGDGDRYKVDVYNVYLFKSVPTGRDFSFSVSSLAFLGKHGFDFNKLTRSGVSHMNLDELERALRRFHLPNGIEAISPQLSPLVHHLQKLIRSEVARSRRRSTGSEGAPQHTFTGIPIALTQSLNPLEKAAVLYKLQGCTPGVRLEIQENLLTVYPDEKTRKTETKKQLFADITKELMGASDLIMAIIEKKLPVVGHNAFRDLLYIYEYFIADLPPDLATFKRAMKMMFPVIVDTKILAEECKHRLSIHGVMNYRLESLNAFFDRLTNDRKAPNPKYEFEEGLEERFRTPDTASMHDAAVDAVSTGQTFIRLSHMIAIQEGRDSKSCLSFKCLLYTARPYSNRLPVPLLGVPFININGDEPPSRNPDSIILEMIAQDDAVGLGALRKELRDRFGRWRCEVRQNDDNRIHVATNTDTTYWRVFRYYSMHPSYRVLSIQDAAASVSPDAAASPVHSIPSSPTAGSSSSNGSAFSSFQSTPQRPLSPTGKLPYCLSQIALDFMPVPAFKWCFAACTFAVASHFLVRRPLNIINE